MCVCALSCVHVGACITTYAYNDINNHDKRHIICFVIGVSLLHTPRFSKATMYPHACVTITRHQTNHKHHRRRITKRTCIVGAGAAAASPLLFYCAQLSHTLCNAPVPSHHHLPMTHATHLYYCSASRYGAAAVAIAATPAGRHCSPTTLQQVQPKPCMCCIATLTRAGSSHPRAAAIITSQEESAKFVAHGCCCAQQ